MAEVLRYLLAGLAGAVVGVVVARWMAHEATLAPSRRRKRTGRSGAWLGVWHGGGMAAGALALAGLHHGSSAYALTQSLFLLFVMYALAALDLLTLQVDQRLVLAGLVARLGAVALWERPSLPSYGLGMVVGAGMITLAALAYQAVRGRVGLGEGDAGVLALAGAFVGWQALFLVLLIAAAAGVVVGLAVLLTLRKPLDTPIPFVPFLCLGAIAVHLLQQAGVLAGGGFLP